MKPFYVRGTFGDIYRLELATLGRIRSTNIDHPAPSLYTPTEILEKISMGLYQVMPDQDEWRRVDENFQAQREGRQ